MGLVKRLFLQCSSSTESIPMIVATFAPASYPLLFELILIVGATFFGSARYACGVTTLVSALGHIAFLSFHRANASGIFFNVLLSKSSYHCFLELLFKQLLLVPWLLVLLLLGPYQFRQQGLPEKRILM
jgi:hypothetical protein